MGLRSGFLLTGLFKYYEAVSSPFPNKFDIKYFLCQKM